MRLKLYFPRFLKMMLSLLVLTTGVFVFRSAEALASYAAAQAYFNRRDYPSAANAFFQAYGYPKGKGEKAKAEWGLAQSLQRLGLFYSASKYYSVIVRRGRKGSNPFFRHAFEELGKINHTVSLGQSHIVQLFKTKIDPSSVPGPARGFYFYYLGIEAFNKKQFEKARAYFKRVPSNSPYSVKAIFHLGVVANLSGSHSRAITHFERVKAMAPRNENGDYLREIANLNIARVSYEQKRFADSIRYYGQTPRNSDNWLQGIFESAWAYFMLQKHNLTLGQIHTIHSPFFENRFYPESYILQAITFLRLCRYKQVKLSLKQFRNRYKPVFNDLRAMLKRHRGNKKKFFKLVYDYRIGALNSYRNAWPILDSLSRTDAFKEANNTIRFVDQEIAHLSRFRGRWSSTGLLDELRGFLTKKKSIAVTDAGKRIYNQGTGLFYYLTELSRQTHFINAEMLMGKVDALRARLKVKPGGKKVNFIGGMKSLSLTQQLEYWPFEGEYWEDELGYYVYNIGSKCTSRFKGKKSKRK